MNEGTTEPTAVKRGRSLEEITSKNACRERVSMESKASAKRESATTDLLGSLLSRLGDLATLAVRLLDRLDDTDSDGLTHVADLEIGDGRRQRRAPRGGRRRRSQGKTLTAKRPSGGYSANDSTHIGLEGTILTMAASPDLTNLGASSIDLPDLRSIFSRLNID